MAWVEYNELLCRSNRIPTVHVPGISDPLVCLTSMALYIKSFPSATEEEWHLGKHNSLNSTVWIVCSGGARMYVSDYKEDT